MAGKQKQAFVHKEETVYSEIEVSETAKDIAGQSLDAKDTVVFPHTSEDGTTVLATGVIHTIFTSKSNGQTLRMIAVLNPETAPEKMDIVDKKNENILKINSLNLAANSPLHQAGSVLNP
jgi:hypothetical protein